MGEEYKAFEVVISPPPGDDEQAIELWRESIARIGGHEAPDPDFQIDTYSTLDRGVVGVIVRGMAKEDQP